MNMSSTAARRASPWPALIGAAAAAIMACIAVGGSVMTAGKWLQQVDNLGVRFSEVQARIDTIDSRTQRMEEALAEMRGALGLPARQHASLEIGR